MLFSEKYGYKPVKSAIQLNRIDQDLRIGLWTALDIHYFKIKGIVWPKD